MKGEKKCLGQAKKKGENHFKICFFQTTSKKVVNKFEKV